MAIRGCSRVEQEWGAQTRVWAHHAYALRQGGWEEAHIRASKGANYRYQCVFGQILKPERIL
ncbi:hypothetical protein BC834DRAFT_887518 [Gloeopeniophorella convolvens]|nr:hypothetical protein BC834DRAFT_887518 [Gloeopeniophorella convolvens]